MERNIVVGLESRWFACHLACMSSSTENTTKLTRDELALLKDNARFQAKTANAPPVEWWTSEALVSYEDALAAMERRVDAIARGEAAECVWLLEHPPIYTAGTSANEEDLVDTPDFPVHETGRGGQYTYHGPGQRVCYVMLDLKRRRPDVRAYVIALEDWLIGTLDAFNVVGERREDRVGVWIPRPTKAPLPDGRPAEDKIAAIGIRLRKWVSFHGVSINHEPDLSHFSGIVPCGVQGHGITSLVDLGLPVSLDDLDLVLKQNFEEIFGPTVLRAGAFELS